MAAKVLISEKVVDYHTSYGKLKRATVLKFITNLLGFALVFTCYKSVNPLALFISYIFALSGYWTNFIIPIKTK
jgi:F0F1-type ATP synthase assembly protein I